MEEKVKITKKTIELLLRNVWSIECLDLIEDTIADHKEEFGCDLDKYQTKVDNLRKCYGVIEEEIEYGMAVKIF